MANGKAVVRSADRRDKIQYLPDGTITGAALMHLVTLIPREPGRVFSFAHFLESEELNLKKEYRLTVLQTETITCGGRQLSCSKFRLTGGGINPVYYWVSGDGVLQQVMMDDRKVMKLQGTP